MTVDAVPAPRDSAARTEPRTRLVVGTDGSADGRRALEWAVAHAARTGGEVEAVRVLEVDSEPVQWPSDYVASERHRAEVELRETVASALRGLPAPPSVSVTVACGTPARTLVRLAGDTDLLVVGSHGHRHLRRVLLGSVAEDCVRAARCPVVIVPPR